MLGSQKLRSMLLLLSLGLVTVNCGNGFSTSEIETNLDREFLQRQDLAFTCLVVLGDSGGNNSRQVSSIAECENFAFEKGDEYCDGLRAGQPGQNPVTIHWGEALTYGRYWVFTCEIPTQAPTTPAPAPTAAPAPPAEAPAAPAPVPGACNASGSSVNNGYVSENECEGTFSRTLECRVQSNGCWVPGAAPAPVTAPVTCNASGSIVNNGYISENECEATFSRTLECRVQSSGCWTP